MLLWKYFAFQGILQELNKTYDIIKQVTQSLMKFHATAASQAKYGLTPETLVDGRYTHQEVRPLAQPGN